MKKWFVLALFLITFAVFPRYRIVDAHQTHAVSVKEPLGTPEAPEIRNDPTKPAQILEASCSREFDAARPRCTAKVKFADSGGPWGSVSLLWTIRYDKGGIHQSTMKNEGRQPGGIMPDQAHFKPGEVLTMGNKHTFGAKDKDGKALTIVNAAVEVKSVE